MIKKSSSIFFLSALLTVCCAYSMEQTKVDSHQEETKYDLTKSPQKDRAAGKRIKKGQKTRSTKQYYKQRKQR